MADANPISPPPPPSAADPPLSPVSRTGTFPHKTSPAVATTTPFIDTDTPAINDKPVELDGIPTSPDNIKRRGTGDRSIISPGLGEEEVASQESLGDGDKGAGQELREKRAALLSSRSKDPGVIVDVPQDPTAEEVEAAKSAEGTTTPAVPSDEFGKS